MKELGELIGAYTIGQVLVYFFMAAMLILIVTALYLIYSTMLAQLKEQRQIRERLEEHVYRDPALDEMIDRFNRTVE